MNSDIIHIASSKNPRLKNLAKLRQRRHRKKTGQTIVYGAREIGRAIEAGAKVEELFISSDEYPTHLSWVASLPQDGVAVLSVAHNLLRPYLFGERNDGCLAIAHIPNWQLEDLKMPACPSVAIVEHVEKPGNLGAILRSADGAGMSAVIVADPATDLMNPNVIRASMGTIFSVPCCTASVEDVVAWVAAQQLQVVTACVDAEQLYHEIDFTLPTAVVLGSEANGLGPHWETARERPVKLPMFGIADSLNVSATAAVLFYEVLRQRCVADANREAGG